MTSSDNDAGRIEPSDSTAGGSEPSSAGYEAPPLEQSSSEQGYTPPPAYNPAPPPYSPPPGDYPPPPSGYPPPYPDPASTPPYPGYGGPSFPPPGPYGTAPGGYAPPPMGYPGADYGYGAPIPPGTNTMAIASLVASIVGVCCGIGSIVGIVLGILAINQIKQTRQAGHGLAVAGIAVGAVTLVISLVWSIAAFNS